MLAVILTSGIFFGSVTSTALHATKKTKQIYQTIPAHLAPYISTNQWQIKGEGPGGPHPLIRPDACLRLKFLHRQDGIRLFNWLILFLRKRALHFAIKLNSRDIQNCNFGGYPPM